MEQWHRPSAVGLELECGSVLGSGAAIFLAISAAGTLPQAALYLLDS